MISVSVIICSYNPNPAIYKRCLDNLSLACADSAPNEVIIVDNNSDSSLDEWASTREFINKVPCTRVVRETEQGLTIARLRGIKESVGELLIFIDDDNFVRADFIKQARNVALTHPFIGAFSGQVELLPETEPAQWTRKYWGMLVHRLFTGNHWSNIPFNNDTMPCGAGLCILREVGKHYLELHETGKRSIKLDRSKNSLLSGGDNDLAMCAIDIGKGMGLFEALHLNHYIPANRFSLNYLVKLTYGIYYSFVVLKYYRTGEIETVSLKRKLLNSVSLFGMKKEERQISKASYAGLRDAAEFLSRHKN